MPELSPEKWLDVPDEATCGAAASPVAERHVRMLPGREGHVFYAASRPLPAAMTGCGLICAFVRSSQTEVYPF